MLSPLVPRWSSAWPERAGPVSASTPWFRTTPTHPALIPLSPNGHKWQCGLPGEGLPEGQLLISITKEPLIRALPASSPTDPQALAVTFLFLVPHPHGFRTSL